MEVSTERRGAVAGGHPETVSAAAETLARGGNAFDAAVAGGFAAAAAEPGLTSLGGGGFLLARTAEGVERLFDFFVDTPGLGRLGDHEPHLEPVVVRFRGADQVFHVGYGSVAVPGCLAGYLHVHAALGSLPLGAVLEPARRVAGRGIVLNSQQAHIFELLEGIFLLTHEGRAAFAPDGKLLGEGDPFSLPHYAEFLDQIASGAVTGFDAEPFAPAVERLMDAHAGLLTRRDLEAYRVCEREPLSFDYRGARVITNPPPSFGGSIVSLGLDHLESRPAGAWGTPETASQLASILVLMHDTHRSQPLGPQSTRGTTHLSVADGAGNVASMTTSNGSNSGIFVPGTGVHVNNIMGEEDLHPHGFHALPPGQRVGSMMAPTIVTLDDGDVIALGSGGSERIRSAITQVISNVVDHGLGLQEAVDAPRIHWDGTRLQIEPGFDPRAVEALAGTTAVNVWDERNLYFGGTHAVSVSGHAAGDGRRGGSVSILGQGGDR